MPETRLQLINDRLLAENIKNLMNKFKKIMQRFTALPLDKRGECLTFLLAASFEYPCIEICDGELSVNGTLSYL